MGGASHLWAILYLCKEALKNKDISYVHIISGEDWPCKNIEEIYDFFEGKSDVYMQFQEIEKIGKIHMQRYYSFLNLINYRKLFQKLFVRGLWLIQKILKVNRLKKLDFPLYSGLVWGELPRAALEYCFEYIYKNPEFPEFLEYGFASEEFFFGSIFMQSSYWKERCVQNNFRYMQWEKRNGSYPAILDESDYEKIKAGGYFFMRKVRMPISEKLMERFLEN